MIKKILFLINPAARRTTTGNLKKFCDCLEKNGAEITRILTKNENEAVDIVKTSSLSAYDVIAIAGGDGTLTSIAQGIYQRQKSGKSAPPLWIVPLGTVNVLARELKIPRNLTRNALALLYQATPQMIWPGRIKTQSGEKIFLQMASAGPDAEAVATVSSKLKKYLGPLAYLISVSKFIRQNLPNLSIRMANGQEFSASCAIFSRGTLYGGSFPIAKPQHPNDRTSTLILFQTARKSDFLKSVLGLLLPFSWLRKNLLFKIIPPEESCFFEGRNALNGLQADGDSQGNLPVEISCADFPLYFLF